MSIELANGHARLEVDCRTKIQARQLLESIVFREFIVPIDVNDMATVRVKRTGLELISEQSEGSSREIKQRADARVGLAVVVAEVAFEVANDSRNPPVAEQLPVIREPLVQFDLQSPVLMHWVREAIRHSVGAKITRNTAVRTCGRIADRADHITVTVVHL